MVDISINRIREVTSPARGYLFDVILPTIPGAVPPRVMATRVVSADIPEFGTETMEVHFMGHKKKIPGVTTFDGTWAVTLNEDLLGNVYNYLMKWKELYCDLVAGRISSDEAEYKRDVPVRLLDGKGGVIHEYLLHGVYPESVGKGTLNIGLNTFLAGILLVPYSIHLATNKTCVPSGYRNLGFIPTTQAPFEPLQ